MTEEQGKLGLDANSFIKGMDDASASTKKLSDTLALAAKKQTDIATASGRLVKTISETTKQSENQIKVTERIIKVKTQEGLAIKQIITTTVDDIKSREKVIAKLQEQESAQIKYANALIVVKSLRDSMNKLPGDVPVERQIAYNTALERAAQLIAKHNIGLEDVTRIWDQILSGKGAEKEAGNLSKLQTSLGGVVNAYKQAAKSSNIFNEEQRKLTLSSEAALAAQAKQAVVATKIKGFAVATPLPMGATLNEAFRYNSILNAINDTIITHNLNLGQVSNIWKQLSVGNVLRWKGAYAELQGQMLKLKDTSADVMTRVARDAEKAKKASEGFLIAWKSIYRMLTVHLGYRALALVTTGLADSLRTATELSKRIAEIQTITQDMPLAVSTWQAEMIKLSNTFGLPLLDQVEGAYQAISNQITRSTDTIDFLRTANELAITTNASVADSIDAISAVINAYGMNASDAEEISATLFKTVDLGNVRLSEMAKTIGRTAVTASQLGITFKELFAQISAVTIAGFPFEHAQTQMLGMMQALIRPTKEMSKLLVSWGYDSGEAAVQGETFAGVMAKITEHAKGSQTVMAALVPRIRGLSEAILFMGPGADNYKKALDEITNSTDNFRKAVEISLGATGRKVQENITSFKNAFASTASDVQKWFITIAGNANNLAAAGDILAKTITGAVIPAFGALTFIVARAAILNPWVAAFAAVSSGAAYLIGVVATTVAKMESAADAWIETWRKAYSEYIKLTDDTFNTINSRMKVSIDANNRVIESSIAKLRAFFVKASSEQIRILTGRTEDYKKNFNELDFDFSSALKPAFNELKDRFTKAEDTLNSYKKSLTNAKKVLEDFPTISKQIAFKLKLEDFDKIPKLDDLKRITSEIGFQTGQYNRQNLVLKWGEETLRRIKGLEIDRNKILKDQIAEDKIKSLTTEIDALKDEEIQYKKNTDRIAELTEALKLNERDRLLAATNKKRDAEANIIALKREAKTAGITGERRIELLTEIAKEEEKIRNLDFRRNNIISKELDTLNAQNKSLESQLAKGRLLAEQREKELKTTQEYQAAAKKAAEYASEELRLRDEIHANAKTLNQEQVTKGFESLRKNSEELDKINDKYNTGIKLNFDNQQLNVAEATLNAYMVKQLDTRVKLQEAEVASKKLQDDKITAAKDVLSNMREYEKILISGEATDEQRKLAVDTIAGSLVTVNNLLKEQGFDVKSMIPNIDYQIHAAENLLNIEENRRNIMSELLSMQERLTKKEQETNKLQFERTALQRVMNESYTNITNQVGEIVKTFGSDYLTKGEQLFFDPKNLDAMKSAMARFLHEGTVSWADTDAFKSLQKLIVALDTSKKAFKTGDIEASAKAFQDISSTLNEALVNFKDKGPLPDMLRSLRGALQQEVNGVSIRNIPAELTKIGEKISFNKADEVALSERLAKVSQSTFTSVQTNMQFAAKSAESISTSLQQTADYFLQTLEKAKQIQLPEKPIEVIDVGPGHAMGGLIKHFAKGGSVTDTVPAMLTPGEFVVKKAQTDMWRPFLEAINSGMLNSYLPRTAGVRGYSTGGTVTNVGDIHISVASSGKEQLDVQRIGQLLRREIRRGTLSMA